MFTLALNEKAHYKTMSPHTQKKKYIYTGSHMHTEKLHINGNSSYL